jgi:hypothetical protein
MEAWGNTRAAKTLRLKKKVGSSVQLILYPRAAKTLRLKKKKSCVLMHATLLRFLILFQPQRLRCAYPHQLAAHVL